MKRTEKHLAQQLFAPLHTVCNHVTLAPLTPRPPEEEEEEENCLSKRGVFGAF
jgi:hypothetical protein